MTSLEKYTRTSLRNPWKVSKGIRGDCFGGISENIAEEYRLEFTEKTPVRMSDGNPVGILGGTPGGISRRISSAIPEIFRKTKNVFLMDT